jgi:hypothetical protein
VCVWGGGGGGTYPLKHCKRLCHKKHVRLKHLHLRCKRKLQAEKVMRWGASEWIGERKVSSKITRVSDAAYGDVHAISRFEHMCVCVCVCVYVRS